MNQNQNPYEHGHDVHSAPTPRSAPQSTGPHEPSPFAVHGNPTERNRSTEPDGERHRRRVMWIRPTDLPTQLVGSKQMLAGIDLHAALVKKLWRQPAKAVEAVRRRIDRADEHTTAEPRIRAPQHPSHEGVDRP